MTESEGMVASRAGGASVSTEEFLYLKGDETLEWIAPGSAGITVPSLFEGRLIIAKI